ncbi:MAG: hypothetical protein M3N11_04610 [Actinomycetota bacterium]|nr:hypothetical protein [Actinomycetota bacterium]
MSSGTPTSAGSQLSSVATALAELTARVTEIAEALAAAERDDLAAELFEAERSMLAAGRRLEKVVDDAS